MNVFKSKIFSIFTIMAVGWLIFSSINIKTQEEIVNKEVKNLEKEISYLEGNNNSIERIISYLKHPSFLEKEARSKLNYKALNEEVAFVYPDKGRIGSVSVGSENNLNDEPRYREWLRWFMGKLGFRD